jgi:hypothetical protein
LARIRSGADLPTDEPVTGRYVQLARARARVGKVGQVEPRGVISEIARGAQQRHRGRGAVAGELPEWCIAAALPEVGALPDQVADDEAVTRTQRLNPGRCADDAQRGTRPDVRNDAGSAIQAERDVGRLVRERYVAPERIHVSRRHAELRTHLDQWRALCKQAHERKIQVCAGVRAAVHADQHNVFARMAGNGQQRKIRSRQCQPTTFEREPVLRLRWLHCKRPRDGSYGTCVFRQQGVRLGHSQGRDGDVCRRSCLIWFRHCFERRGSVRPAAISRHFQQRDNRDQDCNSEHEHHYQRPATARGACEQVRTERQEFCVLDVVRRQLSSRTCPSNPDARSPYRQSSR